ncbi:MAG: class I SAM-dependent methyltransferase [Lentisphaerae bacterium]|nr:MAG: class I SAM-dependent methyltransferase [Lentisphaerota bacterium]
MNDASHYGSLAPYYERLFPPARTKLDFLLSRLPQPPATILDIGCGPGSLCGALTRLGFTVHGLDLDPRMIEQARTHYPECTFDCADFLQWEDVASFDAVLCLGNTLSYFSPVALPGALRKIGMRLKPGGRCILQTVNWDFLQSRIPCDLPPIQRETLLFRRTYRSGVGGTVIFRWELSDAGKTVAMAEDILYPHLRSRLEEAACQAGLRPAGCYRDWGGHEHEPNRAGGTILCLHSQPRGLEVRG